MHDGLASSLSESIVEGGTVVLGEVVTSEGLTTVLVDSLEDLFGTSQRNPRLLTRIHSTTNLVTSGVAETGEQGGKLAADGSISVLLKDNLVELRG